VERLEDRVTPATIVSPTGSWAGSILLAPVGPPITRSESVALTDPVTIRSLSPNGVNPSDLSVSAQWLLGGTNSVGIRAGYTFYHSGDPATVTLTSQVEAQGLIRVGRSGQEVGSKTLLLIKDSQVNFPPSFTTDGTSVQVGGQSGAGRLSARVGDLVPFTVRAGASLSGTVGEQGQHLTISANDYAFESLDLPDAAVGVFVNGSEIGYGFLIDDPYVTGGGLTPAGELVRNTDPAFSFQGGLKVGFYWASGPTRASAISLAGSKTLTGSDVTPGLHPGFSQSLSELTARPPGATHVLVVLDPDDAVGEFKESNNVGAITLPGIDVRATSLTWDAVNGGVRLGYANSAALPATGGPYTFNLYWVDADGAKVSGRLLSGGNAMTRSQGTYSEHVSSLAAPPPTAKGLLLVVDDLDKIVEPDGNNTWHLAYDPKIELLSVALDGDERDDVIGRFIAGLPLQNKAEVQLSDELRAMFRAFPEGVSVAYDGGPTQVVGQSDGRYEISFPVGTKEGMVPLTVRLADTAFALKVFSVPEPKWLKEATGAGEPTWEGKAKRYTLEATLVGVEVSDLFRVPDAVPVIGGKKVGSFSATLTLTAIADLNPDNEPTTTWKFATLVKWLDTKLAGDSYTAPGGPLTATLGLDGLTLDIDRAVFQYKLDDTKLAPIDLFKGLPLTGNGKYLKATSELTLSPTVAAAVRLEFDADTGRLKQGVRTSTSASGSYATAALTGEIAGTLAGIGLATQPPAWLTNAGRLAMDAASAQPSLIAQGVKWLLQQVGLEQYLPSLEFQLKPTADSRLSLTAGVLLGSQVSAYGTGSVNLKVTGQLVFKFAGKTYLLKDHITAFDLDKELSVEQGWTW
jgi:hypothetical protein